MITILGWNIFSWFLARGFVACLSRMALLHVLSEQPLGGTGRVGVGDKLFDILVLLDIVVVVGTVDVPQLFLSVIVDIDGPTLFHDAPLDPAVAGS